MCIPFATVPQTLAPDSAGHAGEFSFAVSREESLVGDEADGRKGENTSKFIEHICEQDCSPPIPSELYLWGPVRHLMSLQPKEIQEQINPRSQYQAV